MPSCTAEMIPRCPATDLFGHKGRAWLAGQDLPPDEQAAAVALLRQWDFYAEELPASRHRPRSSRTWAPGGAPA
jgi:hypothetical protein